jgi:hypothetical protein
MSVSDHVDRAKVIMNLFFYKNVILRIFLEQKVILNHADKAKDILKILLEKKSF